MTGIEARQKVLAYIDEINRRRAYDLVLVDSYTVTKPYGWIFFYNSLRWIQTRDIAYAIAGNGPLVVLAESGELVKLGTALPPDEEIVAFERARGLKP